MKIAKYCLGNQSFTTWKEVKNYTKTILAKGCRLLNKTEKLFAEALFYYHPNAKKRMKDGIALIEVGVSTYGSGYCFIITDLKGNKQDISHKKCSPTSKRNPTKAKQKDKENIRLKAYRNSVNSETRSFFMSTEIKNCNCCGSTNSIQVDHVIPFVSLVNDFEQSYDFKKYPGIKRVDDLCYPFQFANGKFLKSWKAYHLDNAQLQLLCGSCNARKHSGGVKYLPKQQSKNCVKAQLLGACSNES